MNQVTVLVVLSLALTVSAKYTVKCEFGGVPQAHGLMFQGYSDDEGWAVNPMDHNPFYFYWDEKDMTINGHSATFETDQELKPDGDCPKSAFYMGYMDYETTKQYAMTGLEFHSDSDPENKCIYRLGFDVNDESQFVHRPLLVLRLQEN